MASPGRKAEAIARSHPLAYVRHMDVYSTLESPLGTLTLVASDEGLHAVHFPPPGEVSRGLVRVDRHPILRTAREQLAEYFAGKRTTFSVQLAARGTPFQRACWDQLRAIPHGTTITYAELARRLGDEKKTRAVGAANGRNPIGIIVPCHRVIGADGSMVGFGGGMAAKRWLLEHESGQSTLFAP